MAKVVYNACYGGFSLSEEALELGRKISGNPAWGGDCHGRFELDRHDPVLAEVVEKLGKKANGECANLRISEVASGSRYRITEYDGFESVEYPDDIFWEIAP